MDKPTLLKDPSQILSMKADCLWIWLQPRKEAKPLASRALRYLDWYLQGMLSRLVIDFEKAPKKTLFYPTQSRIEIPWLAIETGEKVDWDRISENCEGMSFDKVFFYCENSDQLDHLDREAKKTMKKTTLILGADSTA